MKVTWEYLILLTVILFALYTFNKVENFTESEKDKMPKWSVCEPQMIKKAYESFVFKPRRPEHIDMSDPNKCSKTAEGGEIVACPNKQYSDDEIKSIFRVEGVPENCILELVKVWGW